MDLLLNKCSSWPSEDYLALSIAIASFFSSKLALRMPYFNVWSLAFHKAMFDVCVIYVHAFLCLVFNFLTYVQIYQRRIKEEVRDLVKLTIPRQYLRCGSVHCYSY